MQVGIRVPTHGLGVMPYAQATAIRDYAQCVEDLGFDSLWALEHLLVSPPIYRVAWLDPLAVLSLAAGCTRRVALGTAIVVLPLRNPVLLSKEVASLMLLSGGRLILGVAPGWYRPEYEAVGIDPRQRGARTDEILDILRLLLTRSNASYEGAHYRFEDVTIEPRPADVPPIWVAGGSATDPSTGAARIPEAVVRRIASSDGWLAGASGRPPEGTRDDLRVIRDRARAIGRDPAEVTFAQTQFVHVVDSTDRATVLDRQERAFRSMMGDRPLEDLHTDYLFGTIDEIIRRVMALRELGVEHLVLTPVVSDLEQAELIAREILPALQEPVPAG